MEIIQKLKNGQLVLRVEKSIYNHEAILSTAYKYTDKCYLYITSLDSDYYGVYFKAKDSNIDLIAQINDFCNELIDQQLRHNLEESNKSIKELIVKKAFFPFEGHE